MAKISPGVAVPRAWTFKNAASQVRACPCSVHALPPQVREARQIHDANSGPEGGVRGCLAPMLSDLKESLIRVDVFSSS